MVIQYGCLSVSAATGATSHMGIGVDGASPSGDGEIYQEEYNREKMMHAVMEVTGLSAGSHTFLAKYKVSGGGTSYFAFRRMSVEVRKG